MVCEWPSTFKKQGCTFPYRFDEIYPEKHRLSIATYGTSLIYTIFSEKIYSTERSIVTDGGEQVEKIPVLGQGKAQHGKVRTSWIAKSRSI